jgi:epoxyqueuosine reductase
LGERTGGKFRWYVDTGPVLEKAWAERAGIGWIGKNTCAIDAASGSYFFIGILLSTLEIPADGAAVDQCGSCRRCIVACPTQAIVEPYVLDARRCISYLTIEERGPIPGELASRFGSWIFGCDICQDICPYNRAQPDDGDAELAPRSENIAPRLEELAALTELEFRSRFRASPVLRARFAGLLRNVAIAVGNNAGPAASSILGSMRRRPDLMRHPATARAILESLCRSSLRHDEGEGGSPPVDDKGPAPRPSS